MITTDKLVGGNCWLGKGRGLRWVPAAAEAKLEEIHQPSSVGNDARCGKINGSSNTAVESEARANQNLLFDSYLLILSKKVALDYFLLRLTFSTICPNFALYIQLIVDTVAELHYYLCNFKILFSCNKTYSAAISE